MYIPSEIQKFYQNVSNGSFQRYFYEGKKVTKGAKLRLASERNVKISLNYIFANKKNSPQLYPKAIILSSRSFSFCRRVKFHIIKNAPS
jgi:hypothetical protein